MKMLALLNSYKVAWCIVVSFGVLAWALFRQGTYFPSPAKGHLSLGNIVREIRRKGLRTSMSKETLALMEAMHGPRKVEEMERQWKSEKPGLGEIVLKERREQSLGKMGQALLTPAEEERTHTPQTTKRGRIPDSEIDPDSPDYVGRAVIELREKVNKLERGSEAKEEEGIQLLEPPGRYDDGSRVFEKNKHPDELRGQIRGLTSIKARQLTQFYIGKWQAVSALVVDVFKYHDDSFGVRLGNKPRPISSIRADFSADHAPHIAHLDPGNRLRFIGEIESIDEHRVEYVNCIPY
jgi:hypothetical protein